MIKIRNLLLSISAHRYYEELRDKYGLPNTPPKIIMGSSALHNAFHAGEHKKVVEVFRLLHEISNLAGDSADLTDFIAISLHKLQKENDIDRYINKLRSLRDTVRNIKEEAKH